MAVFLDLENIAIGAREAQFPAFDIRKVLERLLLKGHIVVKKAYCDFDRYKDFKRGLQVSEKLDYGMVGLNRGLVSDPAAPFGGMKQSGIGREGGHEGLMEFLETQYVSVEW